MASPPGEYQAVSRRSGTTPLGSLNGVPGEADGGNPGSHPCFSDPCRPLVGHPCLATCCSQDGLSGLVESGTPQVVPHRQSYRRGDDPEAATGPVSFSAVCPRQRSRSYAGAHIGLGSFGRSLQRSLRLRGHSSCIGCPAVCESKT